MPTFDARSRRICALAFAAAFALAPASAFADASVWDVQQAAAVVAQDPWSGVGDAAFDVDDAFVFADPQRGLHLDADATAVAVKFDQDRIAAADLDPGALGATPGRVAAAFESFVTIGPEGLAYASTEVARSGAASRIAGVSEPVAARVAMSDGTR